MADLVTENKHLKQIAQAKDSAILTLQLQVLQLTEANNEVEGCNCEDCDCKKKKLVEDTDE